MDGTAPKNQPPLGYIYINIYISALYYLYSIIFPVWLCQGIVESAPRAILGMKAESLHTSDTDSLPRCVAEMGNWWFVRMEVVWELSL